MTDLCYPSCEQPQTRRGQERRLALLICATDLFLERGYDAVSLDDIVPAKVASPVASTSPLTSNPDA